jgi:hypothetical protein
MVTLPVIRVAKAYLGTSVGKMGSSIVDLKDSASWAIED